MTSAARRRRPVAAICRVSAACLVWSTLSGCPSEAPRGGAVPADFSAVCPPERGTVAAGDGTSVPAPWTPEERAGALATLTAAPASSSIPPAGPAIRWWQPTPGRKVFTPGAHYRATAKVPPPEGAPVTRVDVHDMLLVGPPETEVTADGRLVLTFETTRPTPPGTVFWGGFAPDQEVAAARLRFHSPVTPDDGGLKHRAELPLTKMLRPRYDPAGIGRRGAGRLGWQLELWDASHASARPFSGGAAFACEPVPCGKGARFGRLPSVQQGPMVDLPTPSGATITFDSDVPTAAAVWWRTSSGETGTVVALAPGTHHELEITGVGPDERVRYHVLLRDATGAVSEHPGGSFRVSPTAPRPVRLAFMSDGRGGYGAGLQSMEGVNVAMTRRLLTDAWRQGADAAFFLGDLVNGYSSVPGDLRRQLEAWQRAVAPVGAHLPIYEVVGNHEATLRTWAAGWQAGYPGDDSAERIFAMEFTNPTNGPVPSEEGAPPLEETVYSVDYGAVHVAVLNTNYWLKSHLDRPDHPAGAGGYREGQLSPAQIQWLDDDLAAARERGARHLVVVGHEPAFPGGGHTQDAMYWSGKRPEMLAMRDSLWAVLVKHGVLLTVFGDEHNYQRLRVDTRVDPRWTSPIWHIVSGGVGAPYYARDEAVPWAGLIDVFSVQQHFVLVTFDTDSAWLEAISDTGQLLDRVDLLAD